jgi:hypothetical protein
MLRVALRGTIDSVGETLAAPWAPNPIPVDRSPFALPSGVHRSRPRFENVCALRVVVAFSVPRTYIIATREFHTHTLNLLRYSY